jgi:hypothetical protein
MPTANRFLVLLLLFGLLTRTGHAQTSPYDAQLIGIRTSDQALLRTRTYQYGKADDLTAEQVLPVIRAHGTARQQRQARRLERAGRVGRILTGIGMAGFLSAGFVGPAELTPRRIIGLSGVAVTNMFIYSALFRNGRIRRLVTAYNDSLLARTPYVRSYMDSPWLTPADTVTVTGHSFRYRELDGVLPARAPGFSFSEGAPRLGVGGVVALGLTIAGTLILSGSSISALNRGDFRRPAWTGLGLTGLAFGLTIPLRQRSQQQQQTTIQQYNRFVRDQTGY